MQDDTKIRAEKDQLDIEDVIDQKTVGDNEKPDASNTGNEQQENPILSNEKGGLEGNDPPVPENNGPKVEIHGAGAIAYITDEDWVYVDPDLRRHGRF